MKHLSKSIKGAAVASVLFASSAFAATPLVEPQWLAKQIKQDAGNLVIIDLRNKIDGGSAETYREGHIKGAVHSDYLQDGWRVERGGIVGLLPEANEFEQLVRKLGVNNDSHVIVVPAGVSSTDFGSAARAYWTFKVYGHDDVSILNGGYQGFAQEHTQLIESGNQVAQAGDFTAKALVQDIYIDAPKVKQLVGSDEVVFVDARTQEQYEGTAKHPKAKVGGRIPGAALYSQALSYSEESNRIKPQSELEEIYADLQDTQLVSYCNTGHWAATNWFVLSEVLGREDVKLYDGSWVEWSDDENAQVATGGPTNLEKIKSFFTN